MHRVQQQDDSPLAGRLSIFWTAEQGLRTGQPRGRLPAIDWLDLLDSGQLVYGPPLPQDLPRPTRAELVTDCAELAVRTWGPDPDWHRRLRDGAGLVSDGRRAASKAALFPVRFLYTLATGHADGTSPAVSWYATHGNAAPELVEAAHR